MKFLKLFCATVITIMIVASCGASRNLTSNTNVQQTNVVLSQKNYHVVKTVQSEVSATYWFGIGGLSKKALKSNAIADLTEKAQLTGSQALINVSVKSSAKVILIYNKSTFIATGTVIEFDE